MLYLLCYRWNPGGWYLHCTDLGHKGRYAWKFCEFIISIWVMPNIKLKPTSRSVSCHHICSHDDDNAVHACPLLWAEAKKQSVSCSSSAGTCATASRGRADTAHKEYYHYWNRVQWSVCRTWSKMCRSLNTSSGTYFNSGDYKSTTPGSMQTLLTKV